MTPCPPDRTRVAKPWTKEQIRTARKAELAPLLKKHGFELSEREAGNFAVTAFRGLLVKDSYWRWPERDQAGNAIDFFVKVQGLSFHEAMHAIFA